MSAIQAFSVSILLIFCLISCKTTKPASSDLEFYGADSQSAIMNFEGEIEFNLPNGVTNKDKLLTDPIKPKIQDLIDWQVKHLYGAFTTHDAYRKNPGIVEGKGITKFVSAEIISGSHRVKSSIQTVEDVVCTTWAQVRRTAICIR